MPDVTITVDGKTISCPPGELVIEAAKRAGIYIPHFCWHPRMDPIGACRMCLVHMEPGPPKPQTACTTRVSDGMVIRTQFTDDKIKDAQEGVLEFLLINHPLDCPICDRAGECPLQDQTQDYGPDETRYVEPKRRFAKPVPISSLINLDRERCILCYRCTRFCEELSGDQLIGTMQRGPRAYIFPFEGESFDSVFSGNTVQICPVGALTSTPYRFQARPWDLRLTASTCNLCASGCNVNLNVRVADGKLVRVGSRVNEAVNEEWLCDKGRYGHAYVSSPDRLAQPWVRRDGELQPVSWDEALTVLTERIGPLLSDRQTDRVGLLLGGSLTDEDAYTAQKFARMVLRTNSVDHRLDGGMAASALMPPALTYDDLLSADHVVVVSADLREELPLVFLRLRIAAARKKLRLSLVHPRRVAGIEFASAHLAPLPGSEAAVASGLAAAMGKPLAAGVEAMAASAGVSTSELLSFAEALGSGGTVILLGPAVAADPAALSAWNAVADACGARVGWAPRRAGEYGALAAGAHPELLPGWRPVADPALRSEVESAWGGPVPEQPGEDAAAVLSRARSGGLDLLWLVGADVLGDI
ncbi:MAG TPA: 2Fe-2S iron-sulfur cluster-binding protein, partial [Actinomycetota bacterium]|nr:2Fe-2S iron-sulfur cluster-binding protein [Actinomycetota bacterium]